MKEFHYTLLVLVIAVLLVSQVKGTPNKENKNIAERKLKKNEKTIVTEDRKDHESENNLKAPEDILVATLVDQITAKESEIDNLSLDSVSPGGQHSSGLFAGLENSLLLIQKAQLDMELVNLGQELKTAVKKRDLKKELKALSTKIVNSYMN